MSGAIDMETKIGGRTQQTSQPVTYTWENIEAEAEIVQGNCFNRKKKPTIRKRILDNGNYFTASYMIYIVAVWR